MSKRTYRMTTALVASLILSIPQNALAQNTTDVLLCLDKSAPPCPAGEPTEGTATPAEDAATPTETPETAPAATDAPASEATGDAVTSPVEPEAPADAAGAATEGGVEAAAPAEDTAAPTEDATDTAPETAATDADPVAAEAPSAEGEVQAGAEVEAGAPPAAAGEDAQPTEVTEDTVGTDVRSSTEEFQTAIEAAPTAADTTATADSDDNGLTNLEKVLIVGLGAVVVGSLLNDGSTVVANTGDRVVVDRNGRLVVYKDDDALLFRQGTNVRTETFADGSARTFLLREDGSQIVTIRDAEGRVLRRTRIAQDGTELRLFDDTVQAETIDIARLGSYARADSISFSTSDDAALRTALQAEIEADRRFSLRQIREYEEVRSLVPSIDLDTINFATRSAAIPAGQIDGLVSVGTKMEEMLIANPREIFLIEGHTDAVGDAASNLALSDRRAESVALALTESFEIPPENLIVQGYGDQFLKVETDSAEQANRRATIRRITPLLTAAVN